MPSSLKRVVIIGAGFAGTKLAQWLDPSYNVTLVDKKPLFFHKISALRAAVNPAWTDSPFIPYHNLLHYGTVLHDEAIDIQPNEHTLILKSGNALSFDVLVLATGSNYPAPAHFSGITLESARDFLSNYQQQVKMAQAVLIAGGGAVGLELAGEIRHLHPLKPITIVHAKPQLLAEYQPALGIKVQRELGRQAIKLILGERVAPAKHKDFYLTTKRRIIKADLAFWTTGTVLNTQWLLPNHADWLNEKKEIIVTDQLRVPGEAAIFAVGDVAATGDLKKVNSLENQLAAVAKNIRLFLANEPLVAYKKSKWDIIILPIGPNNGFMQIKYGQISLTLAGFIPSFLKGKSLFVSIYRKRLNLQERVS